MSSSPPPNPAPAGLVYMLDAAGITIATLEAQVVHLEAALAESRAQVAELTALLAQARATLDVPPVAPVAAEDGRHAHRLPLST